MKSRIFSFFTLLIIVYSLSAMEDPNYENDFDHIAAGFERIRERFSILRNAPDIPQNNILVMGASGSGKTALLQYLSTSLITTGRGFGQYTFEREDGQQTGISDGVISGTTDPIPYDIPNLGRIWDCPGFEDSRGPVQDILNAYNIYTLLTSFPQPKIVLVASRDDIVGRAIQFKNTLASLGAMVRIQELPNITDSLCLVCTKVDHEDTAQDAKTVLTDLAETQKDNILLTTMCHHLLRMEDKQFAFFPRPQARERVAYPPDHRGNIFQSIRFVQPLPQPHIRISLAQNTYLYVNGLVQWCQNEISAILQSVQNNMRTIIADYVDHNVITETSVLRKYFSTLARSDDIKMTENSFFEDAHTISNKLRGLNVDEGVLEQLQHCVSILQFFSQTELQHSSLNNVRNPRIWSGWNNTISLLDSFSSPPAVILNDALVLKGSVIGVSDVESTLQGRFVSSIDLYSFYGLIVDRDMDYPGVHLTLAGPYWWINGDRTINLRGKDGAQTGDPGENGGNFIGIAQGVKGGHLTLNITGGNGATGIYGTNGNIREVEQQLERVRRSREEITNISGIQRDFTLNRNFRETYRSGEYHTLGGNGGNKGYTSVSPLLEDHITLAQQETKNGQDGRQIGRVYRGIRINQYPMSHWRKGLANSQETRSISGNFFTGAMAVLTVGIHPLGCWMGSQLASYWEENPHEVRDYNPVSKPASDSLPLRDPDIEYTKYRDQTLREDPLLKPLKSEMPPLQERLVKDVSDVLQNPELEQALEEGEPAVTQTNPGETQRFSKAKQVIETAQEAIKKILKHYLKEQESQNYTLRKAMAWGKNIQKQLFGQAISFQDKFDERIQDQYIVHMQAFEQAEPEKSENLLRDYHRWKQELFRASLDCECQKAFCTYMALALGTVNRRAELSERLLGIGLGAANQLPIPGISFVTSALQQGVGIYYDRQVIERGNRITALWQHEGFRGASEFSEDLSQHLGSRVYTANPEVLKDLTVSSVKKLGFLGIDQAMSYVATQEKTPISEALAVSPFTQEVQWLGVTGGDRTTLDQERYTQHPNAWALLKGERVETGGIRAHVANIVVDHRDTLSESIASAAKGAVWISEYIKDKVV